MGSPVASRPPRWYLTLATMMTTLAALHAAQARAAALFAAIEARGLIRPGATEEGISRAIFELAAAEHGVAKHWHRRVVRSGPHTRMLFRELPPDRAVEADDIVSLDLGPVFSSAFGELEADVGRTYVLGDDPEKMRLVADLDVIFHASRDHYLASPEITGRDLFAYVCDAAQRRGWSFGGEHAGHLIGSFPFSREERDAARNRIRPDNTWPMHAPAPNGAPRYWILEVHLLDPTGAFGGFFEELLLPS
jgi:Xaa-Pro dipeptidase